MVTENVADSVSIIDAIAKVKDYAGQCEAVAFAVLRRRILDACAKLEGKEFREALEGLEAAAEGYAKAYAYKLQVSEI